MKRNFIDSAFYLYKDAVCCSDLGYEDKVNLVVNFINNREFIRKYNSEVLNILSVFPKGDNDFRIYAAYADIYINIEDYAGAVPYLDSALLIEQSNFMLWEQTILVNNYLEKHEDVVRIAKECIQHFPDKPNIYET